MTRTTLSPERRTEDLRRLTEESFDVLVVGGGVTGAGVALDAATRGMRVAIVEAQDWGAGTSSRSSKLIHGGLRYLQMLDFHLVRQALRERSLLLRTVAPHLVRPVPIVYPLRQPVVERAYVGAGIALYDALAWSTGTSRGLPWHRHLSRAQALAAAPGLRRDSLVGAIEYFDAQVDDARFVTELVRTAVGFGSVAVNRVAMVGALQDGTRVTGARVTDNETGEEIRVQSAVTILATGPWTEDTEAIAGRPRAVNVRPSKGVHLVVGRDKIDASVALVVRTERSMLFVLPWGDHWLIGTTDTDWEHDKAVPVTTAADVDYLLAHVNEVLARPLSSADVEATFGGLRPLVGGVGVVRGPGEQGAVRLDRLSRGQPSTTRISREHAVARPSPGLVVVSGGKFTTYRVMAADAVDAALASGGLSAGPCITSRVRLVGAEGYEVWRAQAGALAEKHLVPSATVVRLLERYGGRALDLLDAIDTHRHLAEPIPDGAGYLAAEAAYAVTHEGARHLDDVLLRRTRIGIETSDGGQAAAKLVAEVVAPLLGWDDGVVDEELEAYRRIAQLEYVAGDRPADDEAAARRAAALGPRLPLP
jgi:glycerol-3-phosphate dehydrogenase